MKIKALIVLVIVALLCTSIVSAGFSDWVTGKAVSLKNMLTKKTPVTADKTVVTADKTPKAITNNAKAELDKTPAQIASLPDNAFWVHWENNINQFDSLLKQIEQKEFTNKPITNRGVTA